jgi:competence protein ComEA
MEGAVQKVRSYLEDIFSDKKTVLKIMSIALILLIAIIFRLHGSSGEDVTIDAADMKEVSDELCVDIGGAVSMPGVYKVKPDTRLFEVIEMAGGLTDNADTDSINQAAYVEDGQKIIIPVRRTAVDPGDTSDETADSDIADISVSAGQPGLININTAGKEDLKSLTGIGDVMAERIIEYRTANPFKSKEDIMSVKGIGTATYDKIKDSITI